jgi:hypothetical protein
MPSTSKAQQKFMGLVHAYKKGEVKGSEVSKAIKKAAKSMKTSSTKKYASTKHKGLPNKVKEEGFGGDLKGEDKKRFERARKANGEQLGYKLSGTSDVKEDRDYKEEYKKYGSSTKSKKYRAELNQYNRKKGTYGNGDGKDASHKGGKIVGFESQSKNRGRAEKSRLKKESSSAYGKSIEKIANDRKLKSISKKDRGLLLKIAKLMKKANEAKKYSDDWNLTKRVTSNFIKQNLKSVDNSIKKKDGEGLRFHLNQIIKGIQNAKRALKLESVNEEWTLYTTTRYGKKLQKLKSYKSKKSAAIALGKLSAKLDTPRFPKKVDGLMIIDEAFKNESVGKMSVVKNLKEDGHTDVASAERKLKLIIKGAMDTINALRGMSNEDSLPSWWTDKITLAKDYVGKSRDYIMNPVESVNEDWWSDMSSHDQAKYIKDHPNSDKAQSRKKAQKDKEVNRKKLAKKGYGIDSVTGKAVKKSKQKEDPEKQKKHKKAISKGFFPGTPEYKKFVSESIKLPHGMELGKVFTGHGKSFVKEIFPKGAGKKISKAMQKGYTLYTTDKRGKKVKKIKTYDSRQAAAVAMGKLMKNLDTDYFPKNIDGLMYMKESVNEATSLGADMLLGGIATVIKKAGMRPKTAKMMGGGFKVSKRDKVGFKIDVEIRGLDKKKTFPLQFETERGMLYVVIKNKPIKLGKYTMATQSAQNLKKVGAALIGDKDVKRIA